jgi:hypothetical protein
MLNYRQLSYPGRMHLLVGDKLASGHDVSCGCPPRGRHRRHRLEQRGLVTQVAMSLIRVPPSSATSPPDRPAPDPVVQRQLPRPDPIAVNRRREAANTGMAYGSMGVMIWLAV